MTDTTFTVMSDLKFLFVLAEMCFIKYKELLQKTDLDSARDALDMLKQAFRNCRDFIVLSLCNSNLAEDGK